MRLPLFIHRFELSGLNLERFLNLAKQQGIPLLGVRRVSPRLLSCECYSADLHALVSLAEQKGWRMENPRALGLSALLLQIQKRPGICAGLALMLSAMLVLSQFVWRIEVLDAGAYQADLCAFLQESGFHPGILRRSVDAQALENRLLKRYPEIAWFHVYVSNMTLVVEVSHGVPMPQRPETEPCDLLAARDGIIHSIRVYAGTPMVKAGDVVQKGDVLIRGVERARDGQQTFVRAAGAAMARCWDSFRVIMPLQETLSTETGREITLTRIHTPWFDWPVQTESPAFLASNLSITQTPVAGVFFPIFFQRLTWREVSLEYRLRDENTVRQEAADAALQQLKNALNADEIIDKWVDYCMIEGDRLAATATAERLVDIGVSSAP